MLNLFYEEPDPDRWMPFDRHLRRVVRRLVRGKPQPGGHARVFINLCAGLDHLGIPYRINDYAHARRHPDELVCIIGKPFVLDKVEWKNPILFGAAGYSHPLDDPKLLRRKPVRQILVPGPWMQTMCSPFWGGAVAVWPVGIDTHFWQLSSELEKRTDVLLYDKVRWEHDAFERSLIEPIRSHLRANRRSFLEIRYGHYREEQLHQALRQCRSMIFLCEHETQGIAYQQALACGVPIFAWDRSGYWQDPAYYPDKVRFSPVTSVPYWDDRCGDTFADLTEFEAGWNEFWNAVLDTAYRPRDYIVENLTLEKCAANYLAIAANVLPQRAHDRIEA